jgi:hypothetical protein
MKKFGSWKEFYEYLAASDNKKNYFILSDVERTMWGDESVDSVTKYQNGCRNILKRLRKTAKVSDLVEFLQTVNQEASVEISIYQECLTDAGTDLGGDIEYDVDVYDLDTRIVFQKAD